jgi:FKBP-type peptidyl-prolyl cis-trans isomerase (trigger factor)
MEREDENKEILDSVEESGSEVSSEETSANTPTEPNEGSTTNEGILSKFSAGQIAAGIAAVGVVVALGVLFATGVIKLPEGSVAYDPEEVVASVNGAPILRGELESRVSQVETAYEAQGAPAGEQPGLRTQILDELVQTQLLKQKAEESGVSVTDEEVETEYQNLVNLFGGEEKLQEQLTSLNISSEQLRSDIRDQVMIQKYLESATEMGAVTVTEEELRAEYDASIEGAAEGQEVPGFEEVRGLIEQQLRQQKVEAIVQEHINSLVAAADIEKNI